VHHLVLELSDEAWSALDADGGSYVEATLRDGTRALRVGVRTKGWTSAQALSGKPSFKIDIDRYVDGQRYHGLEAFDLHAELTDPAAISEWLAYRLFRDQGLPASRTGWAHLALGVADNDLDYGFYTIVEKKDDQLIEHWFDDTSGSLYESSSESWPCDLDDAGCDCFEVDEQGRGDSLDDLEALCAAASTGGLDEVWALVPRDAFLGFMATEYAIGAHDHYAGYSGNFYLYHDPSAASWTFVPSSMNSQFSTSRAGAPSCGAVNYDLDDYQHGILASRCQADGECADALDQAIQSVAAHIATSGIFEDIDRVEQLVAPYVTADPRSPWSGDDFTAQVACIRAWLEARPGALGYTEPEPCLGEGDDLEISAVGTLTTNQRCDRDTPEAPVFAVDRVEGARLTLASEAVGLSAGDEVLVVRVQGAEDVGTFALGTVAEVDAASVVLTEAPGLDGTLTLQRVPRFGSVRVGAGGVLTASAWDGRTGGVLAFRASTLSVQAGGAVSMDGRGYAGGATGPDTNNAGYQGESWAGEGHGGGGSGEGYNQHNGAWQANDGGGGSNITGGGGEHAGGATEGESWNGTDHAPEAGDTGGVVTLERLTMGSGGGGVANIYGVGGPGGAGGGVVLIWADVIVVDGVISSRGEDATATSAGPGTSGAGGGAGGSLRLTTEALNLGAGALDATGGAGASSVDRVGGHGGIGRIRVDCASVNGAACTQPAFEGLTEPEPGHVASGVGPAREGRGGGLCVNPHTPVQIHPSVNWRLTSPDCDGSAILVSGTLLAKGRVNPESGGDLSLAQRRRRPGPWAGGAVAAGTVSRAAHGGPGRAGRSVRRRVACPRLGARPDFHAAPRIRQQPHPGHRFPSLPPGGRPHPPRPLRALSHPRRPVPSGRLRTGGGGVGLAIHARALRQPQHPGPLRLLAGEHPGPRERALFDGLLHPRGESGPRRAGLRRPPPPRPRLAPPFHAPPR
jgi:hypothetical protein